ncbi:iron chelate uptake ABC transporter family permease subunit [Thalassotalea sp. G20_0]|uniref:FecCD family ABC transporter permease n=1 Tax=Gammaproteobacteria TaxID=1236 RepID=UPI001ADA9B0A|nr:MULTISPECIES: iron chelate uptake ABC transporter family permease subunit [Gammaproteobacteria]MBO9494376.1 iron chelate uptake ABC transporter family permease subunit [Thalassotalea sp. G20_0]WBA82029.1 iron chelate uptake ABC transporter family permease subunit [Endozoicomonas sp. GU-1]WBA84977.1 iron chelate uptake ABC transporter family permease subunit [Endozoicomonas sp. GU-1]
MSRNHQGALLLTALAILLPVVVIVSIGVGAVPIPAGDILTILFDRLGLSDSTISNQSALIIESIRLPRTLLGLIVGGSLAVAGASMQGLFRNPLADPSIVGVSSGAALGAGIAIVLGGLLFAGAPSLVQSYSVSILAFVGGVLSTWLVYKVGTTSNGTSVATMLLAGVAINALAGAGMGMLNYVADDTMLRNLTFWQMGSLGGATWDLVIICATLLIPVVLILGRYGLVLNALLLGESEARHLGIDVQKVKLTLIFLTALAVGVSVSVSGFIGFVGLVVPHLIRLAVGPDHRILLPASAMLGGILLLVADMLSRTIVAPAELPIGIVTALMGAPFFLSLLWQQRKRIV